MDQEENIYMDLTTGLAIVGAVSATLTILEKALGYGSAILKKI